MKSSVSPIPPAKQLKDTPEPAELLRLENLDGSAAEDIVGNVEFAQSVPPDVYTKRVASLPRDKQDSNLL